MVNVRTFGAKGDGVTDDTGAIQRAIDAAPIRATVRFPPGVYRVTSVGIRPGLRYRGDRGAVIQRPPGQPNWTRTFTTSKPGYAYSGDTDSPLTTFEGLTFDGDRDHQGPYTKYEREQAHLLFLHADAARPGRLRVQIRDCHFRNNVADGISVYTNVDVTVRDCTSRNCFRGGFVLTGGYTRALVNDFRSDGDAFSRGLDIEVDGRGYGNTLRAEITLQKLRLRDGSFDVAVSEGSHVEASDIESRARFYVAAPGSTLRVRNSTFGVGEFGDYDNRIVFPGDVEFRDCRFYVDDKGGTPAVAASAPRTWAIVHLFWNISDTAFRDQSLRFVDCRMNVPRGIGPTDTVYGVYVRADDAASKNVLTLQNCTIGPGFDTGVYFQQGGSLIARNVTLDGAATAALHLGSADGYGLDVLLDTVRVRNSRVYAHIVTRQPQNRIAHKNVTLDAAQNVLTTQYGLAGNRYEGGRLILGTKPPTAATPGLAGDRYRLRNAARGKPSEWLCRTSGIDGAAVWEPVR